MGNIGGDQKEYEFEPIEIPEEIPVPEPDPTPVPEREPVTVGQD